ncbi:unnamed protein product [Clonostachys chloroleuca]|uniref:BTB domain-containing protein n=1 Tax=Clonostachys chloroleuca TaxID=1926264 RepID=A0AA35QCU5_9HYPO|nr:unnamed protein product [Clonostachys chloroleuca]
MEDEQRKDENCEFLVLICEGKKFHVQKTALFTQSKVFYTAFTGPFQESSLRTYEMSEDSPFIVNKMIDYFNNGDYDVSAVPEIEEQNISALQFHARMFSLADKYAVDILMLLSAAKYLDRLRNSEIVEFLGSIPAVYELTPSYVRDLRNEAIKYARINLPQGLGSTAVRQIYEGIAVIKHYKEYKAAACNVAMTQLPQRADRRGRDEFAQTAFCDILPVITTKVARLVCFIRKSTRNTGLECNIGLRGEFHKTPLRATGA